MREDARHSGMRRLDTLLSAPATTAEGNAREPGARQAAGTEGYTCAICKDVHFVKRNVPWGHPDFGRAVPCRCVSAVDESDIDRLRRVSGITKKDWRETRLETLDPGVPPRSTVEDWMAGGSAMYPFLTLAGKKGTGKTSGGIAAAIAFIEQGRSAHYTTTIDLMGRLRATFDREREAEHTEEGTPPAETVATVSRFLKHVTLLVLDDLGKERATPFATEAMFSVIDHRYREDGLTIITTNKLPDQAPEEPLWSRVFGDRHALTVILAGRDKRFVGDPEEERSRWR